MPYPTSETSRTDVTAMPPASDLQAWIDAALTQRDRHAAEQLTVLLPQLTAPVERARVHLAIGVVHAGEGAVATARRWIDRGLIEVPDDALDVRLALLNTSGVLLLEEGRPHEALHPLLLVSHLATAAHAKAGARARINLAFCLLDLGDLDGAADRAEDAWSRREDTVHDPCHALWVLTEVAWRRQDAAAIRRCRQRLLHAEPRGEGPRRQRREAARAYALARTHLFHRAWDDARDASRIARAAFSSTAMNVEQALCDVIDVRAALGQGDVEAAWQGLQRAQERPGLTGPVVEELLELLALVARHRADDASRIDALERLAMLRGQARDAAGTAVRALTEQHLDDLARVREVELATLNATLQRTLEELEASRMALQTRVEERTAELEALVDTLSVEVTYRRQAEEAALAASRTKSQFLARMSHELRTPLNAVQGYAEILLEDVPTASCRDVERVLAASSHLRQMIDDLLDLARVETGDLPIRAEPVALQPLLDDIQGVAEVLVTRRGLAFHDDRLPCPTVTADPLRIRQVLLNLVGNAAKFTAQGSVTLWSRTTDDEVRIGVTDTGIGIASGDLERVFSPFEQVDTTTTRSAGGAGLGLAIARQLARRMGGDLGLESTPGVGSTFTLRLPRRT
jgi:signal transduction histidine kinase